MAMQQACGRGLFGARLPGARLDRWRRLLACQGKPQQKPEAACICSAAAGGGGGAAAATAAARGPSGSLPQAGDLLELTCTDLAFGGEVSAESGSGSSSALSLLLPAAGQRGRLAAACPAAVPSVSSPCPPPQGICRHGADGFVVFVDRALPGERLTARVLQSKKSFARAAKLATLAPHEHAVEPQCQVGGWVS